MNVIAGFLYGTATSSVAAIVLAFAFGGLNASLAGTALALGCLGAAASFWATRARIAPSGKPASMWEWAAIALFTLFASRSFLWLIYRAGDEIKVLSPNNLGDLSLHLTYIQHIANGSPFWPVNPVVFGVPLTYPLGMDLLNSLLVLTGIDIIRGLIWTGLIGSVLAGVALWKWGRGFAIAGFLCNGGVAGFAALWTFTLADYQAELAWKSFPLALFVTQRGLLYALPAGLLLLCSWRARYWNSDTQPERLPFWGECILYAAMPLFHVHTFIFLSFLLLVWFVSEARLRIPLLRFVGIAFLPATILVLLVTGGLQGPSVLGWHPGWMQGSDDWISYCSEQFGINVPWLAKILFWPFNFGALLVVTGALVARWIMDAEPGRAWARAWLIPALALFALCCAVRFAPWEWDNTKLMLWSYLLLLPLIWTYLLSGWPAWGRALGCIALFGSGFFSLVGGLDRTQQGFTIASRAELDTLRHSMAGIAPQERFLAHPTYNHPLLLLGHPLALGYTGHVWSHGYPWQKPAAEVASALQGDPGWRETAERYGARYLFWGALEEEAYPDSQRPWESESRVIATGTWGSVYDLTQQAAARPEVAEPQPID